MDLSVEKREQMEMLVAAQERIAVFCFFAGKSLGANVGLRPDFQKDKMEKAFLAGKVQVDSRCAELPDDGSLRTEYILESVDAAKRQIISMVEGG